MDNLGAYFILVAAVTVGLALYNFYSPTSYLARKIEQLRQSGRKARAEDPEEDRLTVVKPTPVLVPVEVHYGPRNEEGHSDLSYWEPRGEGVPFIAAHFPHGGDFFGHTVMVDGYGILCEEAGHEHEVGVMSGSLFRLSFRMAKVAEQMLPERTARLAPTRQRTLIDGRTVHSERELAQMADEFELKR